jgi:predicted ATPase
MSKAMEKARRVTHVHLENWRNFATAEVDLQRRVFLVGPNASGKSNFLDVFRFLHDIASVGGGFQDAVGKRGGVSELRCLAARRYPDIVIRARIGNDADLAEWEYEVRFAQDNQRRPVVKRERVSRRGQTLLDRPDEEDREDEARLTQTHLEQVTANREFREVADFLASVRYLHIVPQLIREPDRSVGRKDDPFGGDFLERIARTNKRTQEAWLRRITHALRIAVPQLGELELWRDPARGTPHLRGKYEHWRPRGKWQTEEAFSDGTLRLLGLLWAVLEGRGPLLLEEPELSLHPEVVRYVPQMFVRAQRGTGRQILVSTHSTDLLQDEGIGLDEAVLFLPEAEGTAVRPASTLNEIEQLLEKGVPLAEAIIPPTKPEKAYQLSLFGD